MDSVSKLTDSSWVARWLLNASSCSFSKEKTLYIYSTAKGFKFGSYKATYKLQLECVYNYIDQSLNSTMKFEDQGIEEEERPDAVICQFQNQISKMTKSNKDNVNFVAWTTTTRNPVKFLNQLIVHAIFQFRDPRRRYDRIIDHLGQLYRDQTLADIRFVVEGREIGAHSAVISISPVMAAMFKDGFKEGQSKTVHIDDIGADVFQEMLRYLYTGEIRNLDTQCATEQLLSAAEKYQIEGLKSICERTLASQVNLENVIRFLVIGHLYSTPELMELSLKCLAVNRENVWSLPEWNDLRKNYPDLFLLASERMSF